MLKNTGKRTFSDIMDDPSEIFKQRKMQHITSMLSEGGTVKYDFMFSLQKIVMAKIVSNLWMNQINQGSIELGSIEDIQEEKLHFNGINIDDIIIAKISQLFLPNCISQQLQNLVADFRSSIVKWIEYHNYGIFYSENSVHSAEDLISDITWTVRGKIDYGQTAKKILANQDRLLSDDCKYKLACMYCLEDEIAVLAPKITANKFYLSDISINLHPMVYFWTMYFTGDNTPMNDPIYLRTDDGSCRRYIPMSNNEYIILHLISDEWGSDAYIAYGIPIKYMWNKLNDEEKAKVIVVLVKNVDNPDVIFSLLSDIQYDLQQEIFKEWSRSAVVLKRILNAWWWWGEYFLPTLHYTLNFIHPNCNWQVLVDIYYFSKRNFKDGRKHIASQLKSLFKGLWQESSLQFKDHVFHLEKHHPFAINIHFELDDFLTKDLCWEKDIDIFELILNDLSPQNKRLMFYRGSGIDSSGIDICVNLIKNDKWNLLELFLKDAISSEKVINQLKKIKIKVKGRKIVEHFKKHLRMIH